MSFLNNISPVERERFKSRVRAISLSFFVGLTLMGVKFYAYRLTCSSAILSDALESIINVVASAFALVSVIMSAMPPDENHPYGHGKIEYFSAGFEGALIILAALGIFRIGWAHLFHPRELPQLGEGLLLLLGAGLINLLLGTILIRVGRLTNSLALVADGRHVLTDVYTSAGMLVGLFLVHLTGWYWLDGAMACLVGMNILWSGGMLVRQAFAGLMDESEPELLEDVSCLLAEHRKDIWIDIHQLRAWRSGNFVHMDFHLILPCYLTLDQAHNEGKKLENLIIDYFGGTASILIHLDPCTDPDCPICQQKICDFREESSGKQINWNRKNLTSRSSAGERLENNRSRGN